MHRSGVTPSLAGSDPVVLDGFDYPVNGKPDGDKALLGEDGQFRTQLVRELSEPQSDVS